MTYRGSGENARDNWPHGIPKNMMPPSLESEYIIYTDGACEPNPGYGGWAAIIRFIENKLIKEIEISGNDYPSTNNRMEMIAVIESLKYIEKPGDIIVYTDSKYVQQGIGNWKNGIPNKIRGWMVGWQARGWRKSTGELLNKDLWLQIHKEIKKHNSITVKHVKGHAGNELNERCDAIAVKARQQLIKD